MLLRPATVLSAFLIAILPALADESAESRNQRIDRLLPKLTRTTAQFGRAFQTPGIAIAIVTPDQVRYITYGVGEVGKAAPITEDTTFQLASVSKPITATYTAALVTQGKLDWDWSVTRLLPKFTFADRSLTQKTTVREMLAQISGLPGGTGDALETLGYGQKRILEQMRFVDTRPTFGEYAYANFGVTVGGVAAATTDHATFQNSIFRTLYRPAGMSTAFIKYSQLLRTKNRAALHFTIDGRSQPLFIRNADAQAPGGGMNSTVKDMGAFVQLYLNEGRVGTRQLIDSDALAELYKPRSSTGKNPITGADKFYGMCWSVSPATDTEPLTITHSGAFFAGARTVVTFWPTEKIGIAVLSNNFPSLLPEALADAFHQLYEEGSVRPGTINEYVENSGHAFNIDGFIDRYRNSEETGPVIDGHPLAAYAGVYKNDFALKVVIRPRIDRTTGQPALFLTAGPRLRALKVMKVRNKTPLLVTTLEGDQVDLDFEKFENGAFQKLKIPDFEKVGWGTLTRVP